MQLQKLKGEIFQLANALENELQMIRRHLHKYPELSFQEYETSKFIMQKLAASGIPYEQIGDTGIKAVIAGEQDAENVERIVGLRADIDALPIQEETGLSFASVNEGVMHACGHDGHTTILLGAAMLLQQIKQSFSGKVVCIFQPGEEAEGAAKKMIEQGVLTNPTVEKMVALHLWPYIPFGSVGVRSGPMTASCDDFTITVYGKSGHSARPHEGIDAINISMRIMQALEHLVLKMNDPLDPVVVHIGKIHGGSARNIIAERTVLEGTCRALTLESRQRLRAEITRLAKEVAHLYNAKAEVVFDEGIAPVYNDETVTNVVHRAVTDLLGADKVVELAKPSLGADDFGEFSAVVPSTYFRLGIKKNDEPVYSLHHPQFNFDDTLLATGAAIFAYIALHLLEDPEG